MRHLSKPPPTQGAIIFRLILIIWLVGLTVGLVFMAGRFRQAQTAAQAALLQAAGEVETLAGEHIRHNVAISRTIPIVADIAINQAITVPVSLVVSHTIAIDSEMPFEQEIIVPVDLEIDETFPVSTTVPFQDEITVPIDDVIYINDTFGVPLDLPMSSEEFVLKVPIRADVPVQLDVTVPIDRDIPVYTEIPVRFPISRTFSVHLDRPMPVKLDVPINIPIETEITVPFSRTIPIQVDVPLAMDVPIDIALSETPFGAYLGQLAESLRQMAAE